jgi:hypothetical protein
MNKDNGFVSAKEIIKSMLPVYDNSWDKYVNSCLFLSRDVFVFRCEQYKKYLYDEFGFKRDYLNCYNSYRIETNKSYIEYQDWLFDFVMSGGLDKNGDY